MGTVIWNAWPANFRLGFFAWVFSHGILNLEEFVWNVRSGLGAWVTGLLGLGKLAGAAPLATYYVFNTPDRSPCNSGNIQADLTSLQALANAPRRFRWCHNFCGSQGPPINAHDWNPGAQYLIQEINHDAETDGLLGVLLLSFRPLFRLGKQSSPKRATDSN